MSKRNARERFSRSMLSPWTWQFLYGKTLWTESGYDPHAEIMACIEQFARRPRPIDQDLTINTGAWAIDPRTDAQKFAHP